MPTREVIGGARNESGATRLDKGRRLPFVFFINALQQWIHPFEISPKLFAVGNGAQARQPNGPQPSSTSFHCITHANAFLVYSLGKLLSFFFDSAVFPRR